MTPKEIYEEIIQILGADSTSYAAVKKWAAEFKQSRDNTDDNPQSSRPKVSATDEQVDAIHRFEWQTSYYPVDS